MKIKHPPFKNRNVEATAIEKSVNSLIQKYEFDLVRYVSQRIFERLAAEKRLKKEIQTKQAELDALRQKQGKK